MATNDRQRQQQQEIPCAKNIQRKFRKGVDLCAYCGTKICEDSEDPIPLNLYPKNIRQGLQFLKIPACRRCNLEKSKVDGDLRDFIALQFDNQNHPVVKELIETKVLKAYTRNNVRLMDRFFEGKNVPITTPSGFLIEMGYEFPADFTRVNEAVTWLTRGMHWAVTGKAIDAAFTKVVPIPREEAREAALMFHNVGLTGCYKQGAPYFCAWVAAPSEIHWAHIFFSNVLYHGRTHPMSAGDSSLSNDDNAVPPASLDPRAP